MARKIMYAISNVEGDSKKKIYCENLEKNEYEAKYKGYLTCIKGCQARIKFTQRKNDIKFFSTWNKEGNLHEKSCPYHVDYKGKMGRKKLNAYYQSIELSEEIILRRLKRKMEGLLKQYSDEDIIDPPNGSMEVDVIGEDEVAVFEGDENGKKSEYLPRIYYEDAEYISTDDIGCRKSVYGFISNVQLEEDKKKGKYAYFNLATKHSTVNIAFPEAFYSNELSSGVQEFEIYVSKVKELVQKHPNKIMVIAYGEITRKKKDKNGVNVSVISPNRILVDNKTYKQIVYG
jgi:predicted transposase YbfD/YdcC